MSGNKEALIRYRAINRCLQNKKSATKDELVRACSEAVGTQVAWRTVASDIHAMRFDEGLKFYAPIVNEKNLGYRYEDPKYSIDNIPLSNRDMDALSFAARLLKQYSSVEIFRQFADAVDRLNERVSLPLSEARSEQSILGFEYVTGNTGSEHLNQLIELIKNKTVARITYRSFSRDEDREYVIHPYYLKQYRNRWYLVGRYEDTEGIRTFGLDRMVQILPDYKVTYRPSMFDSRAYYSDAIGVSVFDTPPVEIKLWISRKQAPYILTLPIHESQKVISENAEGVTIALKVIINYELISSILAMGSDAKVLSPPELMDQVRKQLKSGLGNYHSK